MIITFLAICSRPNLVRFTKMHKMCTITADALIGPVILWDMMNAETYLEVLEDTIVPSFLDIDRDKDMIFMQDRAQPHYATAVCQFLNDELPGRWLGRRGPQKWPARSRVLQHVTFFFGGRLSRNCIKGPPQILRSYNSQSVMSWQTSLQSSLVKPCWRRYQIVSASRLKEMEDMSRFKI